jgi:hypothetical protein
MSVVGCFVGGVGIYKEPSGFAVHLISLTFSTATFDRGALSMPKPAYKTHHPLMELSTQREATTNQHECGKLCIFFIFSIKFLYNLGNVENSQAMAKWPKTLKIANLAINSQKWTHCS